VQIGMWLQLIVVPPPLYVSDCPSISEGKLEGSEVGQRWVRGSGVRKQVQRSQGSVSEMSVEGDFQIRERRLRYISFILQSKISMRVGSA